MFHPEQDDRWLEYNWENCLQRRPSLGCLEAIERLSERFIGCNLAMHLAKFLDPILQARSDRLSCGTRAQDVHDWLLTPASAPPLASNPLVGWQAVVGVGVGYPQPWRRIYEWLARESILRTLDSQVQRTPAYDEARDAFQSSYPRGGPPVDVCRGRTGRTQFIFDRWWDETIQIVVDQIRNCLWPNKTEYTRSEITDPLARALNPALPNPNWLVKLVDAINGQAHHCFGQRWRGLPNRVTHEWLNRLTSRLLAAEEFGDEFEWTHDDSINLPNLLQWIQIYLGPSIGGNSWRQTTLWGSSFSTTPLPPHIVEMIVLEWQQVWEAIYRLLGVGPVQNRVVVEDLFEYTSPPNFESWVAATTGYQWP